MVRSDYHYQASELIFLKLGGSLITDKVSPHTPRPTTLARLAQEIAAGLAQRPHLGLLLGHGSGSFGHVPAGKYATRQGVHTPREWLGFAEVWREAAELNRLVMAALHAAGLPAVAFPPSGAVIARDGQVSTWELFPLKHALAAGLLPVVYGDVVFDEQRGGTILSTEDLFMHLARALRPRRMLLAGFEPGVWADYPACTRLVDEISPVNYPQLQASLGASAATDVTGGMASKVAQMLALVEELPGLEVLIFSAEQPGVLQRVLSGENSGTVMHA